MTHEQHQNVSSLVSDLVQMAEATRRLPEVERELADMRSASSRDGDTIARLERKLMDRSAEIDDLRAKLRSVEAERDDAGFRQLEAEDKSNVLRNVVEGVLSTLGETLGITDGTDRIRVVRMTEIDRSAWLDFQQFNKDMDAKREAERIAAERPSVESSFQLSEEAPVTGSIELRVENSSASTASEEEEVREEPRPTISMATESVLQHSSDITSTASGQSEVPPTAPTQLTPEPAISITATSQDGATFNEPPKSSPEGRYAGKKYHDHPYYVSEESWVANGGTLEDYHWKPAANA